MNHSELIDHMVDRFGVELKDEIEEYLEDFDIPKYQLELSALEDELADHLDQLESILQED